MNQKQEVVYRRITCQELDASRYELNYSIKNTLVEGQPCIMAAAKKNLKTSIAIDAAISLATAKPFLGRFDVPKARRVALMSGESGLSTIQETCRRIAKSKGLNLSDVKGLIISPDLPMFGHADHMAGLERLLMDDEIDNVFFDPAYLCLQTGGNESSLFAMGAVLRDISELCGFTNTTPTLIHHTKKGVIDPFSPPELEHISFAGFQEFARQWLLLGRRERYEPGSGYHQLWLNVGGSAGHSALWGVNIDEGTQDGISGRIWDVEMMTAADARADAESRQQDDKNRQQSKTLNLHKKSVLDALRCLPDETGTKNQIRERTKLNSTNFGNAFAELLTDDVIKESGMEKKQNGRTYETYTRSNWTTGQTNGTTVCQPQAAAGQQLPL